VEEDVGARKLFFMRCSKFPARILSSLNLLTRLDKSRHHARL